MMGMILQMGSGLFYAVLSLVLGAGMTVEKIYKKVKGDDK